MKISIWQFKRSRFTNSTLWRHDLPLITFLLAALIGTSCQLSHKGDLDGAVPAAPQDSTSPRAVTTSVVPSAPLVVATPKPANLEPDSEHSVKLFAAAPKEALLGGLSVSDCADTPAAARVHLTTFIRSAFGEQAVSITVSGTGDAESVHAEVDGARLNFLVAAPVKMMLMQHLCNVAKDQTLIATDVEQQNITEWVELIAPDCEITASATAWDCRLPASEPEAARQELTGIQQTMIRRWSRQPYLLAHRLAVGIDLSQALSQAAPEKALDTFCHVIQASLQVELPATLASHRWQAAVCGDEHPNRLAAARFGLSKTVAEIDFMRQLFERTSRLGTFMLRLPAGKIPTRDVLVSLTPGSDVADNLAHETARMWLSGDAVTVSPEDMPRSCWHPVYGEDGGLLKLARQLAMAGDAARINCEESVAPRTFAAERYFAESITSETAFVLTNGRAKTLRLPVGKYSYTLRSLPDDPEEWDDASQVAPHAAGSVEWDARRPRAVVNTW